MRTVKQEYTLLSVDEMTPHPRNPREGDVGAIHQSIDANGFYGAVVVQKSTGHVIAGNHRLAAAKHHGAKKLPAIVIDVDDESALRILLADNRTSDVATNNSEILAELLRELAGTDISFDGTGYDGDDLDAILAEVTEPIVIAPEGFSVVDPNAIPVAHKCPSCGYEWS